MDGNRRDSGCCPFFCARCNPQLVRWKAGFYGQVTQMTSLSGERRVLTDECIFLILVDSIIEIITEKG